MSSTKMLQCLILTARRRFISQSTKRFESKVSSSANKTSSSTSHPATTLSHSESVVGPKLMAPNAFEKWLLVWMKKFPKGQVPDKIKEEFMYQTKSRARVKAANYICVFATLGFILAVISGKRAAKSGDSIQKRNLDWHKKIQEEHERQSKS